jgi:hypothetical protein
MDTDGWEEGDLTATAAEPISDEIMNLAHPRFPE